MYGIILSLRVVAYHVPLRLILHSSCTRKPCNVLQTFLLRVGDVIHPAGSGDETIRPHKLQM